MVLDVQLINTHTHTHHPPYRKINLKETMDLMLNEDIYAM